MVHRSIQPEMDSSFLDQSNLFKRQKTNRPKLHLPSMAETPCYSDMGISYLEVFTAN